MSPVQLEGKYRSTWLILLGLLGLSLLGSALHLGHVATTLLVFGVALVKAGLVLRRFMHFEPKQAFIALALASPLFLLVAMVVLLWLDFVGVPSGPQLMQ